MMNDSQWHPTLEGKRHYRTACGLIVGDDGRHKRNLGGAIEELELAIKYGDVKAQKLWSIITLELKTQDSKLSDAFIYLFYVYQKGDNDSSYLINEYSASLDSDTLYSISLNLLGNNKRREAKEFAIKSAKLGNENAK